MREKVLFIMQLPPPVHGASMVNKTIAESDAVKHFFETRVLELRFISTLDEMGTFTWKKIGLIIPFCFRLIKLLISFRPQLVYYTIVPKGFAFYRDAFFVLIIKTFGRKIAFHLHSRGIQESIKKNKIKKLIYKLVFRNQTAIALSSSLITEFTSLELKQVLILPNGIPKHGTDYSERNEDIPEIIFLANLFTDKGILIFIEIINELKSRGLNFTANIVGKDGDIKSEELKKNISQLSLSDIVTISGALYGDQKYKALSAASIFVHPSLDEAFPLTILEAMQSSLPVVGSAVGAIPDMISEGRTGFVCEPGNVKEFANKIALLIQDKSYRIKMGEQCYKEYEKKYTLRQFENNLVEVITKSVK